MADGTKVTIYTTEPCRFCNSAKDLLERRQIPFEEVNLAKDPEGRASLAAHTGQMTFPQILISGETLGGFRELLQADRAGWLKQLRAA